MKYGTLGTQKYLNAEYNAGLKEDDLWGSFTQAAYDLHVLKKRSLLRVSSPFPQETEDTVTAFYGRHGIEGGFTPPQKLIDIPFKLYLYGNRSEIVRGIYVHKACADQWSGSLNAVWDLYDHDQDYLDKSSFTSWYGCYNPRPKRGSKNWSMHAWSIAGDFGDDNNKDPMHGHRRSAEMPEEIMDAMEKFFIMNLGRYSGYDFPHFQAIKP